MRAEPLPHEPFPHGTPVDRLLPSAARLHDLADRLDAEGSHQMAALTRRAADDVARLPSPRPDPSRPPVPLP